MLNFFKKLHRALTPPKGKQLSEPQTFWKGVFYGFLILSLLVTFLSGYFFRTGLSPYLMALATTIIGLIGFWVLRFIAGILHVAINSLPTFVVSLVLGTIAVFSLAREMRFGWPTAILNDSIVITMLSFGAFSGSLAVLLTKKTKLKLLHISLLTLSLVLAVGSFMWLKDEGHDPYPIEFEQIRPTTLSKEGIDNPGKPGAHIFDYFTYGSGDDIRRKEYANVKFKTNTVNASQIIPEWKGKKAKWRKRYWGFSNEAFPINGRVWMPKGEGKFPLILIVHGNHGMEHFSDPGYTYLGELFASRGFMAVSVDENFINGTWSGDFRGKEMPARAWLLLKHLEQWRAWSEDESHELYQKADLDNVMLIGHSRGGEAMPIAVTYNKLSHFPDDANVEFDFNFGIKGVAAIAPTDMRYFRRLHLKDVNYFSIQGSYDSDEASFFGLRQYQRVSFEDTAFHFKAGLYAHLANHGQFNSIWGRRDAGYPYGWFLNTAPMMSGEEQRQIAKVYLGAYAEVILNNNKSYLPLFHNAAVGHDWLPDQLLLNNYSDSKTEVENNFEEDIDLTTGTKPNSTIKSSELKIWREEPLKFRDADLQGTKVAILGWENDSDSTLYEIRFGEPKDISKIDALSITMARGDFKELKSKEEEGDLDFSIVLFDEMNNEVSTTVSELKKIAPRIEVKYSKLDKLNGRYGNSWEATLETFRFPGSAFNSFEGLDGIQGIRLVFDKTKKGMLILDDIGFTMK